MASDPAGVHPRRRIQEYSEGPGAAHSFTAAMKGILSVSKAEIVALEKKATKKKIK